MRYNNFYQDKKKTAFFCRKYFQQNLASGGNHYERKHQKHAGAQKYPRLQKRPCSTGNSGYDPGSRRIFTKWHGTAEYPYGSNTESGTGCKTFQNERSCYGQYLRSVLRCPNCDHCLFRQQNGHLRGKRKPCDGKSHECRTCS